MIWYKPYLWIGYGCNLVGAILQTCMLPFADMTLLAANCVFGILFAQILAMLFLDEVFHLWYDLPAIIVLPLGTLIIVSVSNKEYTEFTPELIYEYLINWKGILLLGIFFLVIFLTEWSFKYMF
jgi:hypothetical protein